MVRDCSRSFLRRNRNVLAEVFLGDFREAALCAQLAETYGWTLRWLDPNDTGSSAAVFETENGTVCYQIDCKVFDALIDIKLCCR